MNGGANGNGSDPGPYDGYEPYDKQFDREKDTNSGERSERSSRRRSSKDRDRERSDRDRSDRDRERSDRGSERRRKSRSRSRDRKDRERRRAERGERSERSERSDRERSERDRGERSERDRAERSDRSDRDRGDRGERERSHRDRDGDHDMERSSRRRSRSKDRSRRSSRSRSPHERRERSLTPILLKKRKLNFWDMPPVGCEGLTCEQVKATGMFPHPGQVRQPGMPALGSFLQAMDPALAIPLPVGAFGPIAQSASIARQARRLYCGNIPQFITDEDGRSHPICEDDIIKFFNEKMIEMKLSQAPGNSIVSSQINHDKNYAFIEFRTPEEATAGMAFDGISFRGNLIKIRRPKDYQAPVNEQESYGAYVPGVVSTNVLDSPHKIFVGGLPVYLNEDQVMELLRAFGELRAFNLVKDTATGLSKGYAFCEYLDPDITDIACQGLNGMELADKKLIVQRASIGANKDKLPTYTGPMTAGGGLAPAILPTMMPATSDPSNVLMLLNMVTAEEVADDELWQETLEDTREECAKFGKVSGVKIPRHIGEEQHSQWIGKVFVQFATTEECTAAMKALGGRTFAGRTVVAAYFPEDRFLSNEIPE